MCVFDMNVYNQVACVHYSEISLQRGTPLSLQELPVCSTQLHSTVSTDSRATRERSLRSHTLSLTHTLHLLLLLYCTYVISITLFGEVASYTVRRSITSDKSGCSIDAWKFVLPMPIIPLSQCPLFTCNVKCAFASLLPLSW